ncbi:hypothetical protein B6N13_00310 [Marinomonas sp. UCMA 3892]|uniref:hypothetical protein n=1 Tax=unclassified Marinomonas TaxID=196814 RepID=UPI00146EB760|nr:hypothetical protein [Marinomonas sp. UCMA 3892]NLU96540.1 hypothetical protein [Marinomonas sp. UCMA 3892]
MRATLLIIAVSLVSLTGCEINRVGGKFAGIDIEAKSEGAHQDGGKNGAFCPPGQAKKGSC